jgi:hypothetical protein
MIMSKIIVVGLAIVLCILGTVLVLFELAMLGSETSLFFSGGWLPFTVCFTVGVALLAGGVGLLMSSIRRK